MTPPEIFGAKAPQKECTDKNCPFHGQINVKRELFTGIVIKRDINRSATIEWSRPYYVPKYERYEVRRSRIRVHNPACINAPLGSKVLVAKSRPLSKTKHHIIIQVLEEGERWRPASEEDKEFTVKKENQKEKKVEKKVVKKGEATNIQ